MDAYLNDRGVPVFGQASLTIDETRLAMGALYVQDVRYAAGAWMRRSGFVGYLFFGQAKNK